MNDQIQPVPLVRVAQPRDYYTEFIEGSRWLRRDQAQARTTWFEDLSRVNKDQALFEFEMTLKGLVCFGNPVNHPGPPRRGDAAAIRNFAGELNLVKEMIEHTLETGRVLSKGGERTLVFQRYLASVIAQDHARVQLTKESLVQDTPDQSLNVLLAAFENILEAVAALAKTEDVPFKLFTSVIQMAQREIHRSTYFDPLPALEFRTEFDTIQSHSVLELIARVPSDPARRVISLTFLALYRLLRYLEMIERKLRQKAPFGPVYAWLAALRSDTRALVIFLRRDAFSWISSGFGRQFELLGPSGVNDTFTDLLLEFTRLKSVGELLNSLGNQLRLEQLKVYEHQLPSLDEVESHEALVQKIKPAVKSLRAFLQSAVVNLAREQNPELEGKKIFPDFVSTQSRSQRLRRDIWMFQHILRAFIEKARSSSDAADNWTSLETLRFVREFVRYFRSMGYQLLRYSDYEQFGRFMARVERLREGDALEVQRLPEVVTTCEEFQEFLDQTFEAVSQRDELKGSAFDSKDAARTLKLFLGR